MKKITGLFILLIIISVVVGISTVMAQTSSPSPTPSPTPTTSPSPTQLPTPPVNTYWFQNGAYPTTAYAGTSDTYISKSAATTNYGSAAAVTASGGTSIKHGLVKWNISSIPSSCKVKSASVTFNITDSATSGYYVYAMNRNWVETQANWNQYASGLAWQTPGGTGTSDKGGTGLMVISGSGQKKIAFNSPGGTGFIQNAITNKIPVNILIIYDTNTDSIGFGSKNVTTVSQRPKLEIVCDIRYMNGDANRDQQLDISDVIAIAGLVPQVRPTP